MNTVILLVFWGVMGILVGSQMKNMCYACGLDVVNVYSIVRKIFNVTLLILFMGVALLISAGIILSFLYAIHDFLKFV